MIDGFALRRAIPGYPTMAVPLANHRGGAVRVVTIPNKRAAGAR